MSHFRAFCKIGLVSDSFPKLTFQDGVVTVQAWGVYLSTRALDLRGYNHGNRPETSRNQSAVTIAIHAGVGILRRAVKASFEAGGLGHAPWIHPDRATEERGEKCSHSRLWLSEHTVRPLWTA